MTNNFRKEDLIKHLSNKIGFSNLYSKKIVEDLILIFKNTIKTNNLKNYHNFILTHLFSRIYL